MIKENDMKYYDKYDKVTFRYLIKVENGPWKSSLVYTIKSDEDTLIEVDKFVYDEFEGEELILGDIPEGIIIDEDDEVPVTKITTNHPEAFWVGDGVGGASSHLSYYIKENGEWVEVDQSTYSNFPGLGAHMRYEHFSQLKIAQ